MTGVQSLKKEYRIKEDIRKNYAVKNHKIQVHAGADAFMLAIT